ncbi:hypothetical protein HNQ80_002353 [Anaerosolibacter carboniphilus]|uniref:Uncharacterized protein n=1 Tax=Anaerosolibacter carboniphilus TaxID=1417629 RepID=A0A841KR83_9FIRM|nr:hypothetical protein [Anaerosolibacter carboniphilus]MBB6216254.1 hypothetical protein [Anaerosolibacter carboniphilus]
MIDRTSYKEIELIISQGVLFIDSQHNKSIRDDIFQWLVEKALYNLSKEYGQEYQGYAEIKQALCSILNPENKSNIDIIPDQSIDLGIRQGINEGSIYEAEKNFLLSPERSGELMDHDEAVNANRVELLDYFMDRIKLDVTINEEDQIYIRQVIIEYIYRILNEQCFRVSQIIEEKIGDEYIDLNLPDDYQEFETELRKKLMSYFIGRTSKVELIIDSFFCSLKEIPAEKSKYLLNIFYTILYNKILRADPELKNFQSNLLKDRIIYLDDNLVLAAMISTHYLNKVVKEVLDDCRKLGMQLRINSEVASEVERSFKSARLIYEDKHRSFIDKINYTIVQEYVTNYSNHDIEWSNFEKYYLPLDKHFCQEFGVLIDDELFSKEAFLSHELYGKISGIFEETKRKKRAQYNREEVHEKTIEHDVVNFLHMHDLIKKYPQDILGQRVCFVSLDTCLKVNQHQLKYHFDKPYSKHITEFIGFILPYKINISNGLSKEDYINYIVKSELGLVDKHGIDDIFEFFKKSKINISKLLTKEPEIIKDIIISVRNEHDHYQEIDLNLDIPNIEKLVEEMSQLSKSEKEQHNLALKQKNAIIESLVEQNRETLESFSKKEDGLHQEIEVYKKQNKEIMELIYKIKKYGIIGSCTLGIVLILILIYLFL